MKEILKELGAHLRTLGFKGSGQNWRKVEDDYVFVINIQGSRWGDAFFVNLGAQPVFLPTERNGPLSSLKEYECIMRRRVGKQWPWSLDDGARVELKREIEIALAGFVGRVLTLRAAIANDTIDELLRKFGLGTTPARAALNLARAAAFLGYTATANELVERGLAMAGERATGLIYDLQAVRQATCPPD